MYQTIFNHQVMINTLVDYINLCKYIFLYQVKKIIIFNLFLKSSEETILKFISFAHHSGGGESIRGKTPRPILRDEKKIWRSPVVTDPYIFSTIKF